MPAVAAAIPGALVSVGVGLAVNAVVGLVSSAIAGPPTPERAAPLTTGIRLEPRAGVDVPVSAIFGSAATPGHYWYQNSYGDENEYLQLVYVCGRGEHHSLIGVLGDNVATTLSGSNTNAKGRVMDRWTVGGVPHAWVKYYTGAAGQEADPELVAHAKPSSRWPSTKAMTTTAYVIVTLRFDDKVFPNGIPGWRFVWKGLKVYDRRKDSTQPGGSGSHRWGQPETYEWSDNPAVLQDNWRRGIWVGDVRLLGLGVPESACHHSRIVAAANLCDETVHYDDTDTDRPRYSFGGEIDDEADEAAVMRMFETAMAGYGAEYGGAYAPVPAQTQMPVLTLKDTDRVQHGSVDERKRLDPSLIKTAYNGIFVSPDDSWLPKEYGLRFDAAVESAEGGRRQGKLDLEFVPWHETASAVAEIFRRRDRFTCNETADYGIAAAPLEAGDVVTRESALFGTIEMMVWSKKEIGPETYRLVLRQWDNSIVPTPSEGFIPLPAETIPAPVPDRPITVSGFLLVAVDQQSGPNTVPALRATWTPITDRTVDRIIIKYWPSADDTQVRYQSVDDVASGLAVIEGVLPETEYQAEATIVTTPPRTTTWSTLRTATTGRLIVGDIAEDSIEVSMLGDELHNAYGLVTSDDPASLPATILALQQRAEELALAVMDLTANYRETLTVLSAQRDGANAAVIQNQKAIVSEAEARAEAIEEVVAQLGDNLADGFFKLEAVVNPSTSTARITGKVKATFGSTFSQSAYMLKAQATSGGGTLAQFGVLGSFYIFKDELDTGKVVFSVDSAGDVHVKSLTFDETFKSSKKSGSTPYIYLNGQTGGFSLGVA